jgi:hypothetical protein
MKITRVLPLAVAAVLAAACQPGAPTDPSIFDGGSPSFDTAPAAPAGTTEETTTTPTEPCPTDGGSTSQGVNMLGSGGATGTGDTTCRGVNMMGGGG